MVGNVHFFGVLKCNIVANDIGNISIHNFG
jgi:hypothetical protein